MAPKPRSWNPIAFVPNQVTIISSLVYIALFAALLYVHLVVPSAPSNPIPVKGINITEAWRDLQELSNGYHPYNSRRSDEVRNWLLLRIEEILSRNDVKFKTEGLSQINDGIRPWNKTKPAPVTIFDDRTSNVTFTDDWRARDDWTCYFEGNNILVYIRGSQDEPGDWWTQSAVSQKAYEGKSGVLVNAHYDSVSTGFGATDDGVGVVTILQLLAYFTTEGNTPKRGVVALLNNAEEDGLYGAHAYLRHPLSQFAHVFLNLEGAGAGGRATLFRSTDAEVTSYYSQSPHPFGSVVSGDGFKRGFIRSGTDYSVFTRDLGMRGVDVAFMEPRARYHTNQDDARDTSEDSLWHMLSASLATMKAMTSDTSSDFEGSPSRAGKLDTGRGTDGVWFDLFGLAFAVLGLPTLFALSVTLLVAAPLLLIVLEAILSRSDKWYLFARKGYLHSRDDDEAVQFGGWRGFFRFPIAFAVATVAVVGLAYLVTKVNPFIVYSSEYAVWSMMLTAWFAVLWFLLTGADRIRPSALSRMFSLVWLYALSWIILVGVTVSENQLHVASGYIVVIYNAAIFVALLISYLELFALPKKSVYVEHVAGQGAEDTYSRRAPSIASGRLLDHAEDRPHSSRAGNDGEEATETTSLLRGGDGQNSSTFARFSRRRHPETDGTLDDEPFSKDPFLTKAYGDEQAWSSSLPQWTWILQFIVLAPINIILVGQVALLVTSATHQTPADGNPVLPIYLLVATLTVLLMAPLGPFIHRFTYHVPTFLFLIFVGTLIYNLVAFPFSRDARLKVYFIQNVNLDSSVNTVSLIGLDTYIQDIIAEMPSASGHAPECNSDPILNRAGLQTCTWQGLAPNVVPPSAYEETVKGKLPPESRYKDWLSYNATRSNNSALISLSGLETRACRIYFDSPVSNVAIFDAASDPRYETVGKNGATQVKLFSREWDKTFKVNVTWDGEDGQGLDGRVMCLWSDVNLPGTIPAFDEMSRYMPIWSVATKADDGLVQGWKSFKI